MLTEREKPWKPFSPAEVALVFQDAQFPWWIAGGYAIEQFVGRQFREHRDIDILALHNDSSAIRHLLSRWDCWVADPPGHLRRWDTEESLGDTVHDVWCRKGPSFPWAFQIMLDCSEGQNWQSRRCPTVTKPLRELGIPNDKGTRFLTPEVQLFYKAKAPRTTDDLDFQVSLPLLAPQQRNWLIDAIVRAYGQENAWLTRLRIEAARA